MTVRVRVSVSESAQRTVYIAACLCAAALHWGCAGTYDTFVQDQVCELMPSSGGELAWEDSVRAHIHAKQHGFLLAYIPYAQGDDAFYGRILSVLTASNSRPLDPLRYSTTRVTLALHEYEDTLHGGTPSLSALSTLFYELDACARSANSFRHRQTCTWALTGMWAGYSYRFIHDASPGFDVEGEGIRVAIRFEEYELAEGSTESNHVILIRSISRMWEDRSRRAEELRRAIVELVSMGVSSTESRN